MQASKNILLIRPSCFAFNAETAASNAFQVKLSTSAEEIKQQKLQEFDAFAKKLTEKGVRVNVIDDTVLPGKPDAIFPLPLLVASIAKYFSIIWLSPSTPSYAVAACFHRQLEMNTFTSNKAL